MAISGAADGQMTLSEGRPGRGENDDDTKPENCSDFVPNQDVYHISSHSFFCVLRSCKLRKVEP